MEKLERSKIYQDRYEADYDFESVMVAARQRLILDLLKKTAPKVVIEVGCGMDMLAGRVHDCGIPVEQWIIVEPASRFYEKAKRLSLDRTRIDVVPGFFEDSADILREKCVAPPNFIVCSGLLCEIADPVTLLQTAKELLGPRGVVHVNVPNASSLHRRLAVAMGIIQSEDELSERNQNLLQYRVYNFASLMTLAQSAGFRVVEKGGYFLKPFTHDQMQAIRSTMPENLLDGLWTLGREMPELASEIYVNLEAD